MKKLIFLPGVATLVALLLMLQGATLNQYGAYEYLENDTLAADSLWSTDFINVQEYPYLGVAFKTFNSVDSTKYRCYYKVYLDTLYALAELSDTTGTATPTTILNTSDSSSAWYFKSFRFNDTSNVGAYVKIFIATDATDHGNRVGFWFTTYSWKPLW